MSVAALTWAFAQPIKKTSHKFTLVALANHANDERCSYPSVATIEAITSLDRKTVIAALDALEAAGYIQDTGERKGQTSSVKVYRLIILDAPEPVCKHCQRAKQSQKRNTSQAVSSAEKGTPSAGEAVPFLDGSSTVFSDPNNIYEPLEPEERTATTAAPVSKSMQHRLTSLSDHRNGHGSSYPVRGPLPDNFPDDATLKLAREDRAAIGQPPMPADYETFFIDRRFRPKNEQRQDTLDGWKTRFRDWYANERMPANAARPSTPPAGGSARLPVNGADYQRRESLNPNRRILQ